MEGHLEFDERMRVTRRIVLEALHHTVLQAHVVRFGSSVGGGKMLRARLVHAIGAVTAVPAEVLCSAAAAVEMLHAASLLHDDIVDGGLRRRGASALWVSEGARAAVLLGDLMLSLAAEKVLQSMPARLPLLIATLREMCEAEAEQEFTAGDAGDATWEACVSLARRKTGSLFGFAAACAGGLQPAQVDALQRAGYALGTAYQLADDLLDASPAPGVQDKSLGTDAATGKLTAAVAVPPNGETPVAYIRSLLRESEAVLDDWPDVRRAWRAFVRFDVAPCVAAFTAASRAEIMA